MDLARAQRDHGPGPHGPLAAPGEEDHLLDHGRQRAEPDGALGGQTPRVPGAAEGQMRGEAAAAPAAQREPRSQLPVEAGPRRRARRGPDGGGVAAAAGASIGSAPPKTRFPSTLL
ncbi:hypothetical protein GCM10010319_51250 [Streptomyces blastmyceticus]|uniref:Uncharacterized protein n=1 Tax=Streptomyces blastmyceticus TaxID=68180 RepID=A0ABN0XL78_9ACTN